jgi:hypothetical protein
LLQSTDGLNLTLANITAANLTTLTTKGKGPVIVNATGFQGAATLKIATGSTGNAILIGGAGTNILTDLGTPTAGTKTTPGTLYNILVGGAGQSTITGSGHDILVSGTTPMNQANGEAGLKAILNFWSLNDNYLQKISDIRSGSGVSGGFKLNNTTVVSNNPSKANTLQSTLGGQAVNNNWFLYFGPPDPTPLGFAGEIADNLHH